MKRIIMLLTIVLFVGCNGEKKEAAYECESYLEQANEAFENGYYSVRQARQVRDWNSARRHLQDAMSYFSKAEKALKHVKSVASYYDSAVEDEAHKAAASASDAYSYAQRASASSDNSEVDRLTSRSQSSASEGQKAIERAIRNLWY